MKKNLTIAQTFQSKTVWTFIAGIVLAGVQWAANDPTSALAPLHLSPQNNALAVTILGLAGAYFRKNPNQKPVEPIAAGTPAGPPQTPTN